MHFINLLKNHTNLTAIKFEPANKNDETEGHKLFKKEIDFFVNKIKFGHRSEDDRKERIESCSND